MLMSDQVVIGIQAVSAIWQIVSWLCSVTTADSWDCNVPTTLCTSPPHPAPSRMLAIQCDAQGRPTAEWRLASDGENVLFSQPPVQRSAHNAVVRRLAEAFLPAGFPDSVSPDYLAFNVWDTTQVLLQNETLAGLPCRMPVQ